MNSKQYTLLKLPLIELIQQNYNVTLDKQTILAQDYPVKQENSLLFDQIARLRRIDSTHISELILIVAKKNPKQENALRYVLEQGFTFNGVHYSRFGKSASQGKDGITAFVCDSIFNELYHITQMGIPVDSCVISKYESQRCLVFSSCTLIENYMPNIVIIGEYEKTLSNQLIKYVAEQEKEFIDKETGQKKTYISRNVEEGLTDIRISPFDGCGCHEIEFAQTISDQLALDYLAVGTQIRLPFIKGYSVYVPFRAILREWGYKTVTDIYGTVHSINNIDCIWNISMFKGHNLFHSQYGNNAWNEYVNSLYKYEYKLGISKYSHHLQSLHKYTRMNFQYLQCLDLWNPKYISHYENKDDYDILDAQNDGKIIQLAKYTTSLFEKIIQGDTFYTYKFLGINDTSNYTPDSKYLEAILINNAMQCDPAVKQFLYRKLKKAIDDAKVGKIYCSGFYHTGIGDMIGYLQYAVGENPIGCLREHELYSGNLKSGDCVSFRSPLVDPSEVNRVIITRNSTIEKWFGHFKDQDIVMFNMYDISAPQQGGADFDGDIFFLCNDPIVISSKVDKPIILDIADKITAKSLPYTKENLVTYEIMTRDSRIGEITNAATCIENRYTTKPELQQQYSDYSSLLRVFQGKEIDFLKTGFRWNMNHGLRKYLTQLPYFLLYNYPKKLKTYQNIYEKNKQINHCEDRLPLNAYHSPSPMNELCDYICQWERKKIIWNHDSNHFSSIKELVCNHNLEPTDRNTLRICRHYINQYANEIKTHLQLQEGKNIAFSFHHLETIIGDYKTRLQQELHLDETMTANHVIYTSYQNFSISKAFAWSAYGSYILQNLKENTPHSTSFSIREVPEQTTVSLEYLGKYYEITEDNSHIPMS